MPTKCFTLENVEAKQLEVSWNWGPLFRYTDLTLYLDGEAISPLLQEKELQQGWELRLQDGSILRVEIQHSNLHILHDGKRVRGSVDPDVILPQIYKFVILIGYLKIAAGLATVIFRVKSFRIPGPDALVSVQPADAEYVRAFGVGSIIVGLAFVVVGLLLRRKSILVLFIAIGLIIFDGFFLESILGLNDGMPSCSGMIWAVFLIVLLIQGIVAVQSAKRFPKT